MNTESEPFVMQRNASLREHAQEIIARCQTLAAFTEVPGETTRTFLSQPMQEVHHLVASWMAIAGMRVWVDPVGNLRGLVGPEEAPRLVIASHLDTVPNAGAFDGVLGVLLGITLIEYLGAEALPFAIEVIGFSEEEGIRFRTPFLGSLAVTGGLDAAAFALTDASGTTVQEAIRGFGLDPERMAEAKLAQETFGYLEFHIEQGPVLESLDRPLGVVRALVGQTRMEITFGGQANHAGTTPMHLRHDAMAAAAEWIVGVETLALERAGLVATVGRLEAHPGAGNVIPGRVLTSLDVRHAGNEVRTQAVADLVECARLAANRRGVAVICKLLLEQPAVRLDERLTARLFKAAARAGSPAVEMTSGAGHDAMIVAPHCPSAMLFLRSPGGISHDPREAVLMEDVEAALRTGIEFVMCA